MAAAQPTERAKLCRDSRAASARRPPASVHVSSSAAQFSGFMDLTRLSAGRVNGTNRAACSEAFRSGAADLKRNGERPAKIKLMQVNKAQVRSGRAPINWRTRMD